MNAQTVLHLKKSIFWMRLFAGISLLLGLILMFVLFMAFLLNANTANESVWPIIIVFILITGYLMSLVLILKAANEFSNYVNYSLSSALENALTKQRYFWIIFAVVLIGLFFILVTSSLQSTNYPIENLKEPTLEPPN